MSVTKDDLYYINQQQIEPEVNERIANNTLLYPIAKAFLEKFPQYYDIIKTYENSVESIADIVGKDSILNCYINVDNESFVNFKCWIDNVHIFSPDSREAAAYSNFGYVPTPNIALATKGLYSAIIIGDINYSYTIYHKQTVFNSYLDLVASVQDNGSNTSYKSKIPNGYIVNMPIPIGCKWCALHHYDQSTLIKSGEEMKSMYGYFIVDGFLRYIIPIYKKPFNKPIVVKNNFEEQLARTEVLYTKGYEYENSYYMVGAMVIPKSAHTGRGGDKASPPDFGFSLQFNHPTMNAESTFGGKRSHKLFNFVPIKFLFCAFGCLTDEEMIHYICPQMNDFGLINTIAYACLQGYKHREAVHNASIKLKSDANYIIYDEPMTEFTAKYIIGIIILSDKTKQELLEKANKDENDFKILVVQTVTTIFNERFMPAVGDPESGIKTDRNVAICVELGSIIQRLYHIGYGLEASQDKASLTNRRIRNGQQMSREFKAFHNVRLREIQMEVTKVFLEHKNPSQLNSILATRMETMAKNISIDQSRSLINAFKGTSKEQSKLRTELITCKNQSFVWNHLREIVITSELKSVGASVSWAQRTVHQSEMFFICPSQTPEGGGQTGRFKTPTLYTYITLATKTNRALDVIQNDKNYVGSIDKHGHPESLFTIRVNGSVAGYIEEFEPVEELYNTLMNARAENKIDIDTTIVLDRNTSSLDVWTDTGRIVSPFVRVSSCFDVKLVTNGNNGKGKDGNKGDGNGSDGNGGISIDGFQLSGEITIKPEFAKWLSDCAVNIEKYDEGLSKRFIEYMDPEMAINNAVIAPSIEEFYKKPTIFTHIALPNHLHGIVISIVPGPTLNNGVRAAYLTNHVKQAIGPVLRYPQLKYVGENNILIAPQIPIVRPCTYDYLHMDETPIGQNILVAFMQFKYNQEDAVILNQASVEAGFLKIDSLVTKVCKIDKNDEEFKVPPAGTTLYGNVESYGKIDQATALPRNINDIFYQNDCLIAKITKTNEGISDTSILNEKPDGKYPVSANPRPLRCIVKNKIHEDNKIMKMALFGQYRVPIVGDKFNSEHAQKGTVGKIMAPETLPYTTTGLRPDLIFNPPAIFKRMTFGQIYLPTVAKIAALLGCPIDCTSYHTIRKDEDLCKILKQLGLDDAGYETMYDAVTGRPYKARIFFANHYWERQSHLVEQKLNIRNGGTRDPVTGQPTKGRKHGGGQAVDRMSFDAHVAAGICEIIRDTHLNQGSKIKIGICKRCHCTLGYLNRETNVWMCPRCGAHQDITIREVPPSSVLVTHIFNGLHIAIDYFDNIDQGDIQRELHPE